MYVFDGKEYSKAELEKIFSLGRSLEKIDQRILYAIDMVEGEKILDVGCASGSITKILFLKIVLIVFCFWKQLNM